MKRMAVVFLAVAIFLSFPVTAALAEKPIIIKYGLTVAPDHPNNLAALKFAELVAAKTNGRV